MDSSLNPCFGGMSCEGKYYAWDSYSYNVLILVLVECLAK